MTIAVLAAIAVACVPVQGDRSLAERDGHVPGLFVASSNLPRVAEQRDLPCAAQDARTVGANVVIPWSKVDTGARDADGNRLYDWSYAFEATREWRERDQVVNLLFWGAAQRTFQHIGGEPATPAYVLAEAPVVRCYRAKNDGPGWTNLTPDDEDAEARRDPLDVDVPIHYDEAYQRHYRPAVEAFVRRFEHEPWVNYMRVGIGVGAESYPANGVPNANGPCRDEWEAAGFTTETWREHVLGMIRFLGELEPQAPFVVTLNKMDGDRALPVDAATLAVETYGFGIGTQGATARAIEQYASDDPDVRCYADWCRLFERYRDAGVPLEIQTPNQSWPPGLEGPGGAGTKGLSGALPDILGFALDRGATSIELYPFEWSVANTDGGRFGPYQDDYDTALSRAAEVLRSPPAHRRPK